MVEANNPLLMAVVLWLGKRQSFFWLESLQFTLTLWHRTFVFLFSSCGQKQSHIVVRLQVLEYVWAQKLKFDLLATACPTVIGHRSCGRCGRPFESGIFRFLVMLCALHKGALVHRMPRPLL